MEKILVTRSSMPSLQEYIEEISDIWDTHWMTNMGEKHRRLQSALKDFMGVTNIELLTNGHMAIELTLQGLRLQGEVITTPFTFASTTHAIVRNGLTPVFCDIDERTYTIDVNRLESLITDKTCAILPVHVYGSICDIEAIDDLAKKYGLKVVYDAAHTFGEIYKGQGIGTFGDVSCFSFHATKVFNTIEGGAVCFKDEEFGKILYQLKNFGIKDEVTVDGIGANAKMNEFQAAMGICNLKHIAEEIKKRKAVSELYDAFLKGERGIKVKCEQKEVSSNYAYYPIVIDSQIFGCNRDEICIKLAENNIFARKYFYPITNTFDCFKGQFDVAQTPTALKISQNVLTLPLYADLPLEMVEKICRIVLSCKKAVKM